MPGRPLDKSFVSKVWGGEEGVGVCFGGMYVCILEFSRETEPRVVLRKVFTRTSCKQHPDCLSLRTPSCLDHRTGWYFQSGVKDLKDPQETTVKGCRCWVLVSVKGGNCHSNDGLSALPREAQAPVKENSSASATPTL